MERWTDSNAAEYVHDFGALNQVQREKLLDALNQRFPPPVYREQLGRQRQAMRNAENWKSLLDGTQQTFPHFVHMGEAAGTPADLSGCAVVLTAGGDGERLRASLLERVAGNAVPGDFTKATFQLPDFPAGYGSLQANCAVIADLCRKAGLDMPVIVTTGPASSATARIIPAVLRKSGNFGLANVRTLAQDERLHLTNDGRIVYVVDGGVPRPAVNPDETGGPFVKLTKEGDHGEPSALEWLSSFGCTRIIALQATGLCDPSVILAMAAAGKDHDCVGVGIIRTRFNAHDPFGSFVIVKHNERESLTIVEQGIRNEATMRLTDGTGRFHLPFNTGLYVFDINLLAGSELPDYATPPKEILPSLARSPKIGFAITDLMPCAKNGVVLAIDPDSYHTIKSVEDLSGLAALAKRFGIIDLCARSALKKNFGCGCQTEDRPSGRMR
jgi:hypothetical protein